MWGKGRRRPFHQFHYSDHDDYQWPASVDRKAGVLMERKKDADRNQQNRAAY